MPSKINTLGRSAYKVLEFAVIILGIILLAFGLLINASAGSYSWPMAAGSALIGLALVMLLLRVSIGMAVIRSLKQSADASALKVNHIASSVGKIRASSSELLRELSRVEDINQKLADLARRLEQLESTASTRADVVSGGVKSRAELFPSVSRSNTSQASVTPGRNAAAFDGDKNAGRRLADLVALNSNSEGKSRDDVELYGIVSDSLYSHILAAGFKFNRLVPFTANAQIDPASAYLVIEDSAFDIGVWSGVGDAQGASLYRQLRAVLNQAKANGTVVVYLSETGNVNHFVNEIRKASHVIIEDGAYETQWVPEGGLSPLDNLSQYQKSIKA